MNYIPGLPPGIFRSFYCNSEQVFSVRAAPRHPASPSRTRNKFRVRSPLFLGSAVSSNAEWYIGHALVELLEQERMVSLFSVIDILERRLQDGNSSRDEFMDILEAIEKLRRYA